MNPAEQSASTDEFVGERARVALPRVARARSAIVFAIVVVLVGAGGLIAGLVIPRSPAASGLDSSDPTIVTAQVESRVVATRVVVQGSVVAGKNIDVTPVAGAQPDVLPYVTEVGGQAGQSTSNGALLLAVAGRPQVVLHVATPLYRPLHVGDEGKDVLAFETALSTLIDGDYDVDEKFTENSLLAAGELWDQLGYDLPVEDVAATAPVSSATPTSSAQPVPQMLSTKRAFVDVREIVQIPSETALVVSIAKQGDLAGEASLAQLTAGPSFVRMRLSLVQELDFPVGTSVSLAAPNKSDATSSVNFWGEFEVPTADGTANDGAGRDALLPVPPEWGPLPEGTLVQVSPTKNQESVLALPLTAIREAGTSPHVIIESSPSFAQGTRVDVEVVATGDGWAQIGVAAGLVVGDSVRITP